MKDLKLILKGAKDAIKSKNYEECLKLCKQILKEDTNNYMALVFLGVSFQQMGQYDKALKAFQDAIETNSSNPLAWNGLINYYEKVNTKETKKELIKAYIFLLDIESSEKKLIECFQRLCDLAEYGSAREVVLAIYSLLKSGKCVDVIDMTASIVNILSRDKVLSFDLKLIYEETLNMVLNNQKTVCVKYFIDYFNLMYKLDKRKELYSSAKKMHDMFESDSSSLKWLCKIFNESYIELNVMIEKVEDITSYSDMLLKLECHSVIALFTKSILLVESNKFIEAKELLCEVVKLSPSLLHPWTLLLKCCMKLHLFDEAIHAANKIDTLMKTSEELKENFKNVADVLIIEALSRSTEADDLKRVLQIYEKLNDEVKSSSIFHIVRANINLNNFILAKSLLENVSRIDDNEILWKLLTAQLLHRQKKYPEALELLENQNVELSEWWLQIGMLYWDSGQRDKSLIPYLKAAKLEPNNYRCFLLLGDYYKNANDLDKARRCYEKSFKINTKCAEAGMELSKIYIQTKSWEANLALLQALTREVINKKNYWAWLQLGLHYLEQQNYDEAIVNLRLVIRVDENINCWESLADAYMAKGALTSALKCYEKASLMSDGLLYPFLKLATIKKILGDFTEAKSDFKKILESNNLYVPALKEMAETCLLQAKECLKDLRFGTSRDHAQTAADHLITALQQRDDLACLWKLLGDISLLVTNLPEKYCCLLVSTSFVEGKEVTGNTILEKNNLFTLAAKCYYRSIALSEYNIVIWYDLAVCYLSYSRNTEDAEIAQDLISNARDIAKYCISKEPTSWQHWNLLGNIAIHSGDFKLAQHSFIKAVIADSSNALSWCNLGTMYFILRDFKLANEAYSHAQRADPNYVNSWIGQALLAESLAHADAMDLFRHSTQLGFHKQGALGYANWVCKTLKESPLDAVIYAIHNMHAVPIACNVISWYTELNPLDSTAWNMMGILKERMGLKSGALDAFKNAVSLSNGNRRDLAGVNYGRLLVALDKNSQAIDIFTKIQTASFNSSSGLALALFKGKRYKESYETYESTLHWLSDEPSYQSELLVALASMAYMFEGLDAAKTLLFQSIQLDKPSLWSFYATLSLGLLHKDFNLSTLVLNELKEYKFNKYHAQHLATLSGYFYLLQGNNKTSIREVSKIIHRFPDQATVWQKLSILLIRCYKNSTTTSAKCAQVAMKLGQANIDVTKVLCLVSLSLLIIDKTHEALCVAQKAVHCYPNMVENWSIFIAVLVKARTLATDRLRGILQFAHSLDSCDDLTNWHRFIIASL